MLKFNSKPVKTYTTTNQQQLIIDSTEKSVLVNAVAGSGKTSVLMDLAEKYSNGIYLAFNKAIVKEVISKLPVGWSCKTFNSLGLTITKQYYPKIKVNFNKYKESAYNSFTAVSLATKHMSLNGNISNDSWKNTCDRFRINYKYINEAKNILNKGQKNITEISGEDMLQYPIDNGWKSQPYDIILVDECQDLNPQQISFLSCIPTKRIIFVGDVNQAIYGFRGSDPYAIDKIKDIYKPVEYEMTQSFRCPIEILGTVYRIVPNILSTKTGGSLSRVENKDLNFPDDCFIVSRTNNKLMKLAYYFISNNEHFSIGGTFITKLKRDLNKAFLDCNTLSDMRNNVQYNYKTELLKASNRRWNTSDIENKYDSLLTIIDMATNTDDIINFVKNLTIHSNSSSPRKLMTIHAAKGLENNNVFFIDPESCNYFRDKAQTIWEKQQEDNLFYVACTRSLQNLTFID